MPTLLSDFLQTPLHSRRMSFFVSPDATVSLPPVTRVLFLSDLHLGDGGRTDLFGPQDHRLAEFLHAQQSRVDAMVLLGDIVDLPQALHHRRIRRAHPVAWRALESLARQTPVFFVRGNHDWTVDYEALFPGARRCEAVRLGPHALAWHGHQVDLKLSPWAPRAQERTYAHALLERAVGCRLLPPLPTYDSRPNRVAMALVIQLAHLAVLQARLLRRLGRHHRADALQAYLYYTSRTFLGDPGDNFGATTRSVLGTLADTVICGHSHVPGRVRTSAGVYVNSGTWTHGLRTYAHWDAGGVQVRDVDTDALVGGDAFLRVPQHTAPTALFDWWAEHHRGRLRFDF